MIYQTRQPFSTHRQSRDDVSYLTVNASGGLPWTAELRSVLVSYIPYRQDCTRLCSLKLIAVSHNCTVMLGVVLWTFDNLLWPEAPDVPHIHLPRTAALNSKGFLKRIRKAPGAHKQVCKIARHEPVHMPKHLWKWSCVCMH